MGKFGQILARVGRGGLVLMGQSDQAGMGYMDSGRVWVCVQVLGWVWVGLGGCRWVHPFINTHYTR